jgi:hypothetical protein
MFTEPRYMPNDALPVVDSGALYDLFKDMGVHLDEQDIFASAADHVMHHYMPEIAPVDTTRINGLHQDAQEFSTLKAVGLIDAIPPQADSYTHALVDGGIKKVYDYRLTHLDQLLDRGISFDEVVIFGGQRFRKPQDDTHGRLEQRAQELRPQLNTWGKQWIDNELAKQDTDRPFRGSFASEHQVGILALLDKYKDRLEYCGAQKRVEPLQLHPDLPTVETHFETFATRGLLFKVLDSPAIIRRYLGVSLPIANARPTGSSCFKDWEMQVPPHSTASALLVTNNPHTYRSWHDILLDWSPDPTKHISLEATGAATEHDLPQLDLLWEFGRLVVSLKRAADRQMQARSAHRSQDLS